MIRVRFGGFSLLKITKGLKANWVDKLSHFGGTAGLFSGVSTITFFEILEFIIIAFFALCKYKENKVKISKDLEAKKIQSKEYENKIEDLKKKFDAMEKRMIVNNYTITEDNQYFETYEKKLDILRKKMDAMDKKMDNKMDTIDKKIDNKMDGMEEKLNLVMEKLMAEKNEF